MCVSGGFTQMQIISNIVEVLLSVPERRNEVKNAYLDNGTDLPTQKALGINWNTENDHPEFKGNSNGKPLT